MSEPGSDERAAAESALNRMTDGFVAVDREWHVTFCNERVSDLLGNEHVPELGTSLWEAYPQLRDNEFGAAYRRAMSSGEPQTAEAYYDFFGGWFQATAHPDEEGLSIYFRDVTERRQLEVELRRENELRERVFETTPTGVLVLDEEGRIERANERATELLGIETDPNGLTYDSPEWETFDEDGEPLDRYPVETVLETGQPVENVEHGIEAGDGSRRWLSVSATPIADDPDGEPTRVVAAVADRTEQRELETQLRESAASLHRLYEVAGDPGLSFDEKLRELLRVGRERLGLELGFLTRIEDGVQTIAEAVGDHHRIQTGESCPLSQAYCSRTVESEELLAVYDAEAEGWVGTEPYQVFELGAYVGGKVFVDDELYGTLCFADADPRGESFSDAEASFVELLTQWVSYELDRRERHSRIERQNERLDEFASVVSHDLRNPLNVAAARVEMAAETGDTSHLADARDALDRMDELIDDVLSLARHGDAVVDAEPVPLGDAAERAWQNVTGGDRDATLVVADPPTVRGDDSRILQLFEKLFGNAVDHAGPDVTVTVGALTDEEGFFVADDGPGIPPSEREQVFERGYSTADNGTGFGLGVVAKIADIHDWTVRAVESKDGGARFELVAPAADPFDE